MRLTLHESSIKSEQQEMRKYYKPICITIIKLSLRRTLVRSVILFSIASDLHYKSWPELQTQANDESFFY